MSITEYARTLEQITRMIRRGYSARRICELTGVAEHVICGLKAGGKW